MQKYIFILIIYFFATTINAQQTPPTAFPIIQNSKIGFADKTGGLLSPCLYESAFFQNPFWVVTQNGLAGVVSQSGEIIIPCLYAQVVVLSKETFAAQQKAANEEEAEAMGEKWGLLNQSGAEIVPFEYDEIHTFYNMSASKIQLISLQKNGRWGCLDMAGKEQIPFVYDTPIEFRAQFAKVRKAEKWGFLNGVGKEVVPCIYTMIYNDFAEGLAAVKKGQKWGFVDSTGKEIIPFEYDEANSFKNGYAKVSKDKKNTFIDKKGVAILPFMYSNAYILPSGQFFVYENKAWKLVDKTNQQVGTETFEQVFASEDKNNSGLVPIKKNGRWGSINPKGKIVIACEYEDFRAFSEYIPNAAKVTKNGKQGFIDTKSKTIFPFTYDGIASKTGDYWEVYTGNNWGLVDSKQKIILPLKYTRVNWVAADFLFLEVEKGEATGYIDRWGNNTFGDTPFKAKSKK